MNLNEYLTLAPVLLTGLFAFAGTWAGSRFSRVNEHNQWLRNEKMQICSDFVSKTESYAATDVLAASASELQTFLKEVTGLSQAKMKLVCSMEVVQAAIKLKVALLDMAEAAMATRAAETDQAEVLRHRLREAIAVVEHRQSYFILESSNDLSSGRFHGLGPFGPTLMPMLRLRGKIKERRVGSPNLS